MKKWLQTQWVEPGRPTNSNLFPTCSPTSTSPPTAPLPAPPRHLATSATLCDSTPGALPGPTTNTENQERIQHDRVDEAGSVTLRYSSRLHPIGVGGTPAAACVILLPQTSTPGGINVAAGDV